MDPRKEIRDHKEAALWVLALPDHFLKERLTPLTDTIDWYVNQLVSKCLIKNKISLEFGDRVLIPSNFSRPKQKLIVIGLGELKSLTAAQSKKFLKILNTILEQIKIETPWMVFPEGIPDIFLNELKKNKTAHQCLAQSEISVG